MGDYFDIDGDDPANAPAEPYMPTEDGFEQPEPQQGGNGAGSGYEGLDDMPTETEPPSTALDAFTAEWESKLEEKRQHEQSVKQETVAKAQKELEKFLAERDLLREKKQSMNRKKEQVALEELEADLESENPWERVVKLVDLQEEADKTDLSRIRQIFIKLKSEHVKAKA